MKKVIILIAGMGGTGKTTFAKYLSEKLNIPLVCYDNIKAKDWDITETDVELKKLKLFGKFSYEYFWFFIEEIMKSGSPVIAEYLFHPQNASKLEELVNKNNYNAITVLFDANTETAYNRFIKRNESQCREEGLRVIMPFESFEKCTAPNKLFRFGRSNLLVNTDSFDKVNYDNIINDIMKAVNQ